MLVLLFCLAAGFRILLSLSRTGPIVVADEIGYLANARVLAGGPPIDLSTATYYYSGSSLLIVPAYWLSSDPVTIYQLALVVQALVSAVVLPLLYALCREVGVSQARSLAAAVAASVCVDSVFWSDYVLTESLFSCLLILWVWMGVRVVRFGAVRQGYLSAVCLGVTFGLLGATHPRGLILVAVGGVVGLAFMRKIGLLPVLVCAGTAVVALGVGLWLNVITMRANYPGRSLSSLIPVNGGSDRPGTGLADQAFSTSGQVWYLAVASGLLALYGVLHAWHLALTGDKALRTTRLAAAVLVTGAGAAFTIGSAAVLLVSAPTRSPDYLVYGRYVAALMPVLIAFGVVGMLRTPDRTIWILRGATIALAGVLTVLVGIGLNRFDTSTPPRPFPIPGVSTLASWIPGNISRVHQVPITLVAMVFFAVCCGVVIRPGRRSRAAVVALITVSGVALSVSAVTSIAQKSDDFGYRAGAAFDVPLVTRTERIAWDSSMAGGGVPNIVARLNFAYFANDATIEQFDSTRQAPPDSASVIAASPRFKGDAIGLTRAYKVPGREIVLWTRGR
ncbi:hypothetical protein ABLG96_15590 [Nakamurella sp. A5-74]|uniref:Glycosyltransferase RgtA/B/C/D-like domain-containing protein n=1 Tax=Nakamurella sp. A5-74 TaxID=3158264 RepID=A0AAU8DKZ4_9ACTN